MERKTALEHAYPEILNLCSDRNRYPGLLTGPTEMAVNNAEVDQEGSAFILSIRSARESDAAPFVQECNRICEDMDSVLEGQPDSIHGVTMETAWRVH